MNRHFIKIVGAILLLSQVAVSSTTAATQFVTGTNDGLRTFAILKWNGVEFHTDEMGAQFNQTMWNELSTVDRRALLNVYGWQLSRRADHFGAGVSNDMADWINQEQGWTDAAEALKQKHATKNFPDLVPVFGPGTALEIPDYYCTNPEILSSDKYKEAARLAVELGADYAVGKQVYNMLVNAKWEQVSIAVKTLSEPLIKIIVDNFITGFVTNGASHVSELAATAYQFANDLHDFISNRQQAATPPTPREIIDKLEIYITEMEATAATAVALVEQKKARLQDLATQLKEEDRLKTQAKKDAATTVRNDFTTLVGKIPAASTQLPDFVPADPDASQAAKDADIRNQAQSYMQVLSIQKNSLAIAKADKVNEVTAKYANYIGGPPPLPGEPLHYFPDASDQFAHPYFEIMDKLTDVNGWMATDLPDSIAKFQTAQGVLPYAEADVADALNATLPLIDDLQAKALWLNKYESFLGYKPSGALNFEGLRNFDSLISIAATPERTAEDLEAEIAAEEQLVTVVKDALGAGVSKREAWINSEWSRYDSLRFNFENSLSYVIAALTQLDRLHAGPYFKRSSYPFTCYGGACLYSYSVNVEAINSEISAKANIAEKEAARTQAVAALLNFRAEEGTLAQRLEIAQNSHLNDVQALESFFQSVASRYRNVYSYNPIIAEFAAVTGKTMKGMYDLGNDLVPDITYYYLGSGNWIRNRSNVRTNIMSAVELVSGKIPEYYLMLDLYNRMAADKAYYLSLSEADFNAFMTSATLQRDAYITAFEINNVWGVDFPAWQLAMKTNVRQEDLNSEKRYGIIPTPFAWAIRGAIATPEGKGVPGISVILNGYLTASTTTASDGTFFFDFIGSGDFTLTASGRGYQLAPATVAVTVSKADAQAASFTATPVAVPGYSVAGRLAYENGNPVAGATVSLTPAAGTEMTTLTGPGGDYAFPEVDAGTYTVQPAVSLLKYFPQKRAAVVPASVSGADFLVLRGPAGNLNGDRWIDLTDAVMALQIVVGITPEPPLAKDADVNGDGRINMTEAQYILQILAGFR